MEVRLVSGHDHSIYLVSLCPQHQVPQCSSAMVSASQWMTYNRARLQCPGISFRVALGWAITGRATPVFTVSSGPLMRSSSSECKDSFGKDNLVTQGPKCP